MKYTLAAATDIIKQTYQGKTLEAIVAQYDDLTVDMVLEWMANNSSFEKKYLSMVNISYATYLNKIRSQTEEMLKNAIDTDVPIAERKFQHTVLKDAQKSNMELIKLLGIDKQITQERLASSRKQIERNNPEIPVNFEPKDLLKSNVGDDHPLFKQDKGEDYDKTA